MGLIVCWRSTVVSEQYFAVERRSHSFLVCAARTDLYYALDSWCIAYIAAPSSSPDDRKEGNSVVMALPVIRPSQEEPTLPPPARKQFSNQLAAAVRSINWSYAIFWVLTWKDGFYNGEIKTRKVTSSADLTADQLVLQRSEQLRELYESLLSGQCDHRARRPAAALSPEDLGDAEWYYTVCMSYAFRPGQGLPGRSFAGNEHVWLCNAQCADTKTFQRALLAKTASIQTVACIPLMGGVLELGTTDTVLEDMGMVNRIRTSFWDLKFPTCSKSEEPNSSPSVDDTGDADIVFDVLKHDTMATMITRELEPGEVECLSDGNLERITKEINGFYGLCDELDVGALEENWIMGGSFEVMSSPEAPPAPVATDGVTSGVVAFSSVGPSHPSCFAAWKRSWHSAKDVVVPVAGESQKLLKKALAGGAWANNDDDGTARAQESTNTKNHVISERRRREKLNEMFLILKSLVPSIHKVDKASILAETIAYLRELEQKVEELESNRAAGTKVVRKRHEVGGKKVLAGSKRKALELGGEDTPLPKEDGPSNIVNVTVTDKEVLLEVQCRWKELLMTRVFDAIKSLRLDVLSVRASTPDGLLALKIRAQFAGPGAVEPGMISEALQKAIRRR
ncbi:anthocyanin regulatory R-S protein-like isoform X2 [Triticum urartu]|uniref:anthocyanin regulatory R-S protein-like isoform X2 n=1 Tax=Triticum urartu TaxID=4572 RepID=UPI002042CB41|nr:anthocyanin regulatory R-S protein-like isoform X2 [Triticum urartu]